MKMKQVRAKKRLGQHFLNDDNIAENIVNSLLPKTKYLLEIGPGTGVLTEKLFRKKEFDTLCIDLDIESIDYLHSKFEEKKEKIIYGDFIKTNLDELFNDNFSIIGNLPYNISSQIFFKVLEYRNKIPQVVCMIQKEVAERIASPHGSKKYGILSVFLQTFYNIEYLFTVNENVFIPPPKVKSGVIRLTRNERIKTECDEKFLFRVVKTAFNQRRKTMRNSLKQILPEEFRSDYLSLRPEQLSVEDFIKLTLSIEKAINGEEASV